MHRTLFRRMLALAMVMLLPGGMGCVSVQESDNSKTTPLPRMSDVALDSRPGISEVYIDGEFRGTAPIRLRLAEGTYKITFRLNGFEPWERDLVIKEGSDTNVVANLEKIRE